jgi:CheY-like chemotaxis protein
MICDIGLPGMDGFELVRRLRDDPRTAGAWIVAVTGYGSDHDRALTQESGFDAHLVKPIEAGEILRVLDRGRVARGGN